MFCCLYIWIASHDVRNVCLCTYICVVDLEYAWCTGDVGKLFNCCKDVVDV